MGADADGSKASRAFWTDWVLWEKFTFVSSLIRSFYEFTDNECVDIDRCNSEEFVYIRLIITDSIGFDYGSGCRKARLQTLAT